MAAQPSFFRRHRVATLVAINVLILTLGGLTALLIHRSRQVELGRDLPAEQRMDLVQVRHPILHHALAPLRWMTHQWGTEPYILQTNSLGFADSSMREVPLSAGKRLLIMGDSVTQGLGFEFDDTFAGQIAAELADDDIEVLNAAVNSYAPTVHLRNLQYLLDEVGLDFDELWVFLDISDIQDEAWVYFLDRQGNVRMKDQRRDGQLEYMELYLDGAEDDEATSQRYGINRGRSLWTIRENVLEAFGRSGLKKADAKMTALAQLAKARDIRLGIVVYPWPDQIRYLDVDSLQRKHWRSWAEQQGVMFIDAFPGFLAGVNEGNWRERISSLFIEGDVHLNQQGHDLMARRFLDERARLRIDGR